MAAFLLIFFVAPLFFVVFFAFDIYDQGTYQPSGRFNLNNFSTVWTPAIAVLFGKTAFVAAIVTLMSFVFAYPAAWFIAEQPRGRRELLVMLLVIPFWTSFLLRTYSLMQIFREGGLADQFLQAVGITQTDVFAIGNLWSVVWAEVYTFMPYMALPLYATLERMSRTSIEASYILGAGRVRTFFRVILPLSLPGILAGSILVFIISMGELVIPALVGGVDGFLLGNAIFERMQTPGSASALGLLFTGVIFAASVVYFRVVGGEGLRL